MPNFTFSNSLHTVAVVQTFLDRLTRERFFGAITLKYEGGTVVHLRKEENLKPSELSGIPEQQDATTPRR